MNTTTPRSQRQRGAMSNTNGRTTSGLGVVRPLPFGKGAERRRKERVNMSQLKTVVTGERIESPVLTPEQAAKYVGLGRSKLYQLLAAGDIPSFKIGSLRKVRLVDLDEYLERCRTKNAR